MVTIHNARNATHNPCTVSHIPSPSDVAQQWTRAACVLTIGWQTRAACAVKQREVEMKNGTIRVPGTKNSAQPRGHSTSGNNTHAAARTNAYTCTDTHVHTTYTCVARRTHTHTHTCTHMRTHGFADALGTTGNIEHLCVSLVSNVSLPLSLSLSLSPSPQSPSGVGGRNGPTATTTSTTSSCRALPNSTLSSCKGANICQVRLTGDYHRKIGSSSKGQVLHQRCGTSVARHRQTNPQNAYFSLEPLGSFFYFQGTLSTGADRNASGHRLDRPTNQSEQLVLGSLV